jgi:hypothetical protein
MFLFSPDIMEAYWMEAPLPNGGTKWWLAWLSPSNLTTMWGENRQLVQSKIIATDDAEAKLQVKLDEKRDKGYQSIGTYNPSQHLWIRDSGNRMPAFPPTAKPGAYSESPDFDISLDNHGDPKERLVLKNVRGSFLSLGNAFRLEHYINKPHLTYMTYPTWQTLFTTRDEAVAVVRDVIEKRKAQGMDARGDMELLNPHVPIDFALVPGALAWDF